jgi:predicted MFS family arabinose efflux permease
VLFGPEERQRAIALMASATFISYPIGPIAGGYLLDHFWWGSVFLINVPVVALAVTAVAFLLPESRSGQRARIDIPGVVISSIGLAALTYGFIRAGQDGWTDAAALATIIAGAVVIAGFVWWERLVGRRAQPLVQLGLFRSAGFRWGTILVTLVTFAMFGLMFAMPQYFQEVRGVNAFGSGIRLLPLVGGMIVGMIGGTRLQSPRKDRAPLLTAKTAVTAGFVVITAGLGLGATTAVASGTGFAAAWVTIAGLGLGLALPSAMNAAIGALSTERSGSGSALISALRQVGATIGVAVLGTVLSTGYTSRLSLGGLRAPLAAVVRSSVAGGREVAVRVRSAELLAQVQSAFVHGMDVMLWTCGGIALVSAVLALIFLPRGAGLES